MYIRNGVFAALTSAILITNILALIVIVLRKTSRPSAKFTAVLCMENLTLGGILPILLIILPFSNSWTENRQWWCRTVSLLFISHVLASSWTALLISLDRFIAIRCSLYYTKWITHKSCAVFVTGAVALAFGASAIQIINWDNSSSYQRNLSIYVVSCSSQSLFTTVYLTIIISSAYILPLILNCFIYWTIYAATKHTTALARRNSLQPSHESMDRHASRETSEPLTQTRRQSMRKISGQFTVHKDNRKAAKMGLLVVIFQLVSCLPFSTLTLLTVFELVDISDFYQWLPVAFLFFECVANPIVYILRNRSSQMVLKVICCKKSSEKYHKVSDRTMPTTSQMSVILRLITSHTSEDSVQ